MLSESGTALNPTLRQHEIAALAWTFQPVAELCYRFFDVFSGEFFDDLLPLCFLSFQPTRRGRLGHYRPGHNAVGAQYEINLNPRHLDRPVCEVLGTLLHEMLHLWQELHGRAPKTNWHNREFVDRARALGIPCAGGRRSYALGYTDPFLAILKQQGIDTAGAGVPGAAPGQWELPAREPKLKKWRCSCTNIWAAVTVEAQCRRCGQAFVRQ